MIAIHAPPRPEALRCAVCGRLACYGIGPPGWPLAPPERWLCAEHWHAEESTRPASPSPPRPASAKHRGRLL